MRADPAAQRLLLELAAPQFSEPGEYRLFVQFRVDGAVRTIPINVSVR